MENLLLSKEILQHSRTQAYTDYVYLNGCQLWNIFISSWYLPKVIISTTMPDITYSEVYGDYSGARC